MSARKSGRTRGRSRQKSKSRRPSIPLALLDAINSERTKLCQASAVLQCLRLAVMAADKPALEIDEAAVAAVAAVACDLIDEAHDALDSVKLKDTASQKARGVRS